MNVWAAVITVGPSGYHYTTIQGAINHASNGDTILVEAGTYPEAIEVNKSLAIKGMNGTPVVGNPAYEASVLFSANTSSLENMTITTGGTYDIKLDGNDIVLTSLNITSHIPEDPVIFGSGLSGLTVQGCRLKTEEGSSICLNDTTQVTIKDCSMVKCPILLYYVSTDTTYSDINITNNTLIESQITISSSSSGAITFPDVRDVLVSKNTITDPIGTGIYVGGFRDSAGVYHFTNVLIAQNIITGSQTTNSNLQITAVCGGVVNDNVVTNSFQGADGMVFEGLDWFTIRGNTVNESRGNAEWGTVGFNLETTTNTVLSGNEVNNVDPYAYRYAPGPNFLPNLTFDATNLADGRPVLYFEDKDGISIDSQSVSMVVLMSCSGISITNSTIRNTGLGVGVYNCTGLTIANTSFRETNNGIMLIESANSLVKRNSFNMSFFSIGIGNNANATITGNNFTAYLDSGIVVHTGSSENVTISGNQFTGTMTGKEQAIVSSFTNGDGVTIAHNTILHNSRGLLIQFTENLACIDNTITDNGLGIDLTAARYNLIRNNSILNGPGNYMGVYMFNNYTAGAGATIFNELTNNYIRSETPLLVIYNATPPELPCVNTARVREFGPLWGPAIGGLNLTGMSAESDTKNTWNTTKTPGQNIVGGQYLGGNYWAMPNGSGWSQTHPDRGDGFTEPYVFDANNTDYLPLHYFEGTPLYAPAVISSPGHYVLMNNLVNSSVKSAISINSSDVYLDGGGHLLDGISAEGTAGVSMGNRNLTFSNITVKNLVVTGWTFGVSTDNIKNSSISDVLATGNLQGIAITDSTGCEIQNSTIRENIPWMDAGISMGGNGIMVSGSRGTRITRVNISDNGWSPHPPWVGGYGVNILNSSGSRISDCTVIKNINTGIWVEQSKDVSVVNNEIRDNSGNGGIFMTTVTTDPVMNCTLAGNTVSGSSYGIWLTRDSITVLDNTIDNCMYGIFLENCQNATLAGNAMTENSINFAVVALTNMDYNHQIATSNTVDGKPVYYLVGKPDAVINSTTNAGVVYGISCPNITIRDLSLTHNGYGVFLLDSDDATVENVTSTENVVGIAIRENNETRINQCTARANSGRGIMVESSENVLITDSVASQNIDPAGDAGIGITVKDTNRVIIEGVNASLNSLYGVEISNTNQVLLTDVTGAMNSEAGFLIQGVSIEIADCHIRDNTEVGIGMLDSGHVLIWNNYFSNDLNFAYGEGAVTVPAWNITKTFGTNIVGGPYVGGNYWANPAGTGWSQTHPDRGDGFTEPYVIAANNTDFLPLHKGPGSARMSIPNASIYQNTNTPLPVRIMNISHATGISFNLTYNPTVIRVNEITLNQSYADGSSLTVNATPGLLRISLTCTNPITIAQPIPVFFVNTTSSAPVGSSSLLDVDSAGWGDETFNLRSFEVVNGSVLVYRIRGDLNGNHWVDIGDTAKTAYMVVNLTPHLVPDADFNNNGRIDTGDASMIACYLVGKIGDL